MRALGGHTGFLRKRRIALGKYPTDTIRLDLPSGIYLVTTKDVPLGRCAGSPPKSTVMPIEPIRIQLTAVYPASLGSLVER